jgi:LysR family nitrogen assimilation transcriptional regulator
VDLRQLRYFVALATQQNFNRAADVLHIAQPALSRQIKLLEDEFGVVLFDRHARGATPTPEAIQLLDRASFILRYAERTKFEMQGLGSAPRGTVAVGLTPGLAGLLSKPLFEAVAAEFPEIRLRIVEGFGPALQERLVHGGADIAILTGSEDMRGIESTPLLSEPICAIASRDDERLGDHQVRVSILEDVPLILTGVPKSGIRLELELEASRSGIKLEPILEVETAAVAEALVEAGIGWTVHFAAAVADAIARGSLSPTSPIRLWTNRFCGISPALSI